MSYLLQGVPRRHENNVKDMSGRRTIILLRVDLGDMHSRREQYGMIEFEFKNTAHAAH